MVNLLGRVADAFWRAVAYCLHPRVIMLSVLPLLLSAGLAFGLGYFFWEAAVDGVRQTLSSWQVVNSMLGWLDYIGAAGFRSVLSPLIVLALALPTIIVLSLLLVALLMTPALVRLVERRRFPALEKRRGAPFWLGALWALGHAILAILALVVSMPFWLIPPLVLILPPLIWGWLGYRVFSFDALAEHADDRLAGAVREAVATAVDGRRGRAARQRHAQRLGHRGHRVRGVHAAAGALAGTDRPLDPVDLVAGDLAGDAVHVTVHFRVLVDRIAFLHFGEGLLPHLLHLRVRH